MQAESKDRCFTGLILPYKHIGSLDRTLGCGSILAEIKTSAHSQHHPGPIHGKTPFKKMDLYEHSGEDLTGVFSLK